MTNKNGLSDTQNSALADKVSWKLLWNMMQEHKDKDHARCYRTKTLAQQAAAAQWHAKHKNGGKA